MENWVLTLTILPSVGLLLISTITLSVSLSTELDHLMSHDDPKEEIITGKLKQLKLLSWAMIALYLCAAALALDGLIGALFHEKSFSLAMNLWISIFIFSITSLCVATLFLITFAIRAVSIKQKQFK